MFSFFLDLLVYLKRFSLFKAVFCRNLFSLFCQFCNLLDGFDLFFLILLFLFCKRPPTRIGWGPLSIGLPRLSAAVVGSCLADCDPWAARAVSVVVPLTSYPDGDNEASRRLSAEVDRSRDLPCIP